MPRPVEIRANFRSDTAFLLRFETAVLKDEDLPEEWRRQTAELAHQLATRCMEADALRNKMKGRSRGA